VRRRQLITLLGSTVAAPMLVPLAVRAQQSLKMPTIGFLGANTAAADSHRITAFVQRLRKLGWIEGRNVAIEVRWAEGRAERFAEIAAEFVRLKVDVIITSGQTPVLAAKQATSLIPIVFAAASDPVAVGLVASLARPGGNATGLSIQQLDTATKRLELLRELMPGMRSLAIMGNVDNRSIMLEMEEVRRRPARSALPSSRPKSGRHGISRRPSKRSPARHKRFTSPPIRS
jgi:ABC-type uncharacterized transport system substrate-binding protein